MKINYYLPKKILKNDDLAKIFDEWSSDKIYKKTGISSRHIADDSEHSSDMAILACEEFFKNNSIQKSDIDFIIVHTQTPDYIIPGIAGIIANKIGLSKNIGAFDYNLGCSAYSYGLATLKGLISCGVCKNALLITADSISKFVNNLDKSNRTLFGDAATVTLINHENIDNIGNFVFGTDGSGYDKLIVPASGTKIKKTNETAIEKVDENGYTRSQENLYMDGFSVFNFTMDVVPTLIKDILIKNNTNISDIDLFVFHQANKVILSNLRDTLDIPKEKFYINIDDIGNTTSSSIPIALSRAEKDGLLSKGTNVLIAGFGVGLSWGGTIIKW